MKMSKIAVTLFGAALVFASSAFAGGADKTTINIEDKISVGGKTLNPGTYKVQWDGTGPNVQVTVLHGKDTVATFAAQVKEEASQHSGSAYGTSAEADGSKSLTAIYVGGKRTVLEVQQTAASQQSATQATK
jgi:hypothetical protein